MSTVVTEGRVRTISPSLWDGTPGKDPVLVQAVCALWGTPSHCGAAGQSRQQRGLWGQADLALTYSPPLTPVSPGEAASLVSVVICRMVLLGCSETG